MVNSLASKIRYCNRNVSFWPGETIVNVSVIRLVVEIPNKPWLITNLKPEDKFGNEPNYTLVARSFDPTTSQVTETFTLVAPGKKDTFLLQYRIFEVEELTGLLVSAHFKILELFGDYHGAALNENSANIIAVAQKEV